MHHSTHGNCDGHHWYADFIILCFLMTHFKDLSQAHTITYLKKYNSKIPTFTPSLLNQNIESLNTKCRLQENKMLQKTATTGRQPVEIITWSFRYQPIYQPETPISDRGLARGPILESRADRSGDGENPML